MIKGKGSCIGKRNRRGNYVKIGFRTCVIVLINGSFVSVTLCTLRCVLFFISSEQEIFKYLLSTKAYSLVFIGATLVLLEVNGCSITRGWDLNSNRPTKGNSVVNLSTRTREGILSVKKLNRN